MLRTELTLTILVAALAGCAGVPLPRERAQEPGALLFNGYANPKADCYHCHNGDGAGTLRGPDLRARVPKLTDERIHRRIREGGGIMPAYADKLSAEEVDLLANWLRATFGATASQRPAAAPSAY